MKSTCLTDGVTVRLADLQQPADGRTVAGLIDAYARDPMGGGTGLTAEVRQALPGQLARHPTAFALLAEADGQPVGVAVCVLGLSTFKAQPTVNLHDLAILPAARGRGIGRLLLDGVAAEARRTMSAVFEYAVATLRADSDPVWPVRKALPANKTQHKTALSTAQIGKLLNDFDNHRCTFQINYCMQLMWWTLARPSEVAEAEWTEIDLDRAQWRIPAERMKARKEHVVPLPTQAVEMLRGLKAITGQRKHLFPGRDNRNTPMSIASLRQALKVLGWAGTYSPHATRTTGSTRLNEMGYRPDAIEAQLAHSDQNNVRRAYNHATYFEERQVMMQDWADHLVQWKAAAHEQP